MVSFHYMALFERPLVTAGSVLFGSSLAASESQAEMARKTNCHRAEHNPFRGCWNLARCAGQRVARILRMDILGAVWT